MSSTDASAGSRPADSRQEKQEQSTQKRPWHRRPGRKIDDLLVKRHQHYAPLTRLIRHSDQQESLTATVRALLPEELAPSIEVANYRPPTLIVRVNNASLATRLRYLIPELTTKLTLLADFKTLTKIRLRVVHSVIAAPTSNPPRYLTPYAANSVAQIAASLDNNPEYRDLRAVFLRLSEHTQPPINSAAGEDD